MYNIFVIISETELIMVYTVTLNPALDYYLQVDELDFSNINRSSSERFCYGGKGINVSAVLNELDIPNIATGFSAGFTGAELERLLQCDGIKSDFVHCKNGNTRINVKLRSNCEFDINAKGNEICETDIEALFKKLDLIKDGDFLVLCGSVPKGCQKDIYERILAYLSDRKVKTVVDAEGELLLNCLKYKPFMIKPNHHELSDIFNVEANSDEQVVCLSEKLKEMGARNVLVSRAEKGAILLDSENQVHYASAVKGELVNSTCCGDSMVAGFVAGYINTGDYDYALKLATACGSATAFSEGLGKREEIENLI